MGVPFPRVHDLGALSQLHPALAIALAGHAVALGRLTAYEAGCRYPPRVSVTREQAREAVESAEGIRGAVLPLLEAQP